MIGLVCVVAVVVLLGTGFMGVRSFKRPGVQSRGPWLIGAVACLVATLVVSNLDTDLANLGQSASPQRIKDFVITLVVMAVLAGEAVLISFWTMKTRAGNATYLLVFSCTTLVAWFITFLVMSSVVPGS